MAGWQGLVTLAGLTILAAAIVKELLLPQEQRTWHGDVFGAIPYDFRKPTGSRLFHTLWDPENPEVIVPTVFGVGWSVNIAALLNQVRGSVAGETPAEA